MCPAPARSAIAYEFEGATGRLYQRGAAQVVFFPWPTIKAVAHAGGAAAFAPGAGSTCATPTQPALALPRDIPLVVAVVRRFPVTTGRC
jgi:hypothetical protein